MTRSPKLRVGGDYELKGRGRVRIRDLHPRYLGNRSIPGVTWQFVDERTGHPIPQPKVNMSRGKFCRAVVEELR